MNVLIIEKDMKYCNKLIKVIGNNFDLKFCMISSHYEEIENGLKEFDFNLIIIEYELIDEFKSILEKYSNIVMVIYSDKGKNEFNNLYINKTDSPEEVLSKLMSLLNNNIINYSLKLEIKNELKYLGYNPKYCGTKYLFETIYILLNNEQYNYNDNLEKDIYPIIAKRYGKSVNTIKCNIINATDMMVCECEENKLLEYLGYYDFSKPGPKKIIESIVLRLSKENKISI